MANYTCTYCGFHYNEWHGDTKNGIPAGTPFWALAGSLCSRCGLQGERHIRQGNPKYAGFEAEYYDLFAGKGGIAFYRDWILQSEQPVSVLELGVGTGRILLELAKCDVSVTGVDWSPEMLAVANKKAERMKREVTLVEDDVHVLHLNERYSHILLPDGIFQHFITVAEQKNLLAVVRNHLKDDGLVAIDLVLPPSKTEWGIKKRKQMTEQKLIYFTVEGSTALQHQLFHYTGTYEHYRNGTLQSQYRVARELSLILPRELVYLLTLEGFSVVEIHENYQTSNSWDIMKQSNEQLTYLGKKETLDEKPQEIKQWLIPPYQEDRWNEGGYPFWGQNGTNYHEPIRWTIIAKREE